MPLGDGYYGTDAHGKPESQYCKHCYRDGNFVEPDLKLDQMIHRSVEHMTTELDVTQAQAQELANKTLPGLHRWRVS